jgi:hypothetical protein
LTCPVLPPASSRGNCGGTAARSGHAGGGRARGVRPLLVPARPRAGHTYARLAAGFGIGTATAHRYVIEASDPLAALAPALADAARAAPAKAFVTPDGTLPPIDRVVADRPFCSGKHKKHGMNARVVADPFGRRVGWVWAGAVVVVVCAVAFALVARGLGERHEVLVLARGVPAGRPLTAADVRPVSVSAGAEAGLV